MMGMRVSGVVAGLLAALLAMGVVVWVGVERRLDEQARTIRQLRETVTALRAQAASQDVGDAAGVTRRAVAENCAFELARDFEEFRSGSGRYPGMPEVTLPEACRDLRVQWARLDGEAYRFVVQDSVGRTLAEEGRP